MTVDEINSRRHQLRLHLVTTVLRRERIDLLNELAWFERDYDMRECERLCQEAYTLSTDGEFGLHPYAHGIVAALRTRSILRMWRGFHAEAIANSERALELLQDAPHLELETQILCSLTFALLSAGEIERAMQVALNALEKAHTLHQPEMQGYAFDGLSSIYARVGEWNDALQNALRARDYALQSRDYRQQSFLQNNLAWIYLQTGNTAAARETIRDCLARARDAGYPTLHLVALGTAGEIYLAQNDYANAIETCNLFLAQAQEHGMQHEMVYARRYLGQAHWQNGETALAFDSFHTALALASEFNLPLEEAACHEALAQLYETQNDFQRALQHYKAYQTLREQVVYKSSREIHTLELLEQLKTSQRELDRVYRETAFLHAQVEAHEQAHRTLYELVTQDALTNVFNRRHLTELAEQYLQKRSDLDCAALLLFDIDRFKELNDTHGHLTGDAVLQMIVRRVREHLRPGDLLGRFGGDEFVVVLPNTCAAEAKAIAERLRHAAQTQTLIQPDAYIHISISIGGTSCDPGQSVPLADLIAAADRALYRAKHRGRNNAVVERFTPPHAR
jgi:diguanylate cyclase (GGDEF)-like protein